MAGIYEKGNMWHAVYRVNGKKRRPSTGFHVNPKDGTKPAMNKKRAQQAADLIEQKEKGLLSGAAAATAFRNLAAMVDDTPVLTAREYLTAYAPSGKEQNQANVRRAITRFLDFLSARKLDTFALADIKPKHCAEFMGAMLQEVKVGTVRNYKQALSTAFTRAVRDEYTPSNPFSLLRMDEIERQYSPDTHGKDKTEREPFTAEEMRLILFDLPQPWRDLAAVSFYTGGQRIGDCCRLTWRQVDFERGQIHFVTQKTAKAISHPLTPELRHRLEARKAATAEGMEEYVFPLLARQYNKASGMVSTQFISLLRSRGIIQETAPAGEKGKRRAMVSKSFHSIRHTVVSMLRADNEVSADVCRAIVGHDSETVERAYFTASTEAISHAFSVLEAAVSLPAPNTGKS